MSTLSSYRGISPCISSTLRRRAAIYKHPGASLILHKNLASCLGIVYPLGAAPHVRPTTFLHRRLAVYFSFYPPPAALFLSPSIALSTSTPPPTTLVTCISPTSLATTAKFSFCCNSVQSLHRSHGWLAAHTHICHLTPCLQLLFAYRIHSDPNLFAFSIIGTTHETSSARR